MGTLIRMGRGQLERPGTYRTKENQKRPRKTRKSQKEPGGPERTQGPRRHQRKPPGTRRHQREKRTEGGQSQGEQGRTREKGAKKPGSEPRSTENQGGHQRTPRSPRSQESSIASTGPIFHRVLASSSPSQKRQKNDSGKTFMFF